MEKYNQMSLFDNEDSGGKQIDKIALRNHYTTRFRDVLEEIFKVARGVKTKDYNETWRRVGLKGNYIKIFIKEGRLRELIWEGKEPDVKDESLRDTLIDLAAYAVYSIICIDENNIDGKEFMEQENTETLQQALGFVNRLLSQLTMVNELYQLKEDENE